MPGQPGLDSKSLSQKQKSLTYEIKSLLCIFHGVSDVMKMKSHRAERWYFRSPRKSFHINVEIKIQGSKGPGVWCEVYPARGRGQFAPSPPPALPPFASIWHANADFSGFSLLNSPNCNSGSCCAVAPNTQVKMWRETTARQRNLTL